MQSLQSGDTELDTTTKHPEHPQLQHHLQVPLWQQTFSMECFQPEQPQNKPRQAQPKWLPQILGLLHLPLPCIPFSKLPLRAQPMVCCCLAQMSA